MEAVRQATPASNKRKVFFWTLGISGGAALAFLGYEYWKKKKAEKEAESYQPLPALPAQTTSYTPTTAKRLDNFPLKRGSKGERVRALQLGLQRILGASVLANYTEIDGDFGSGTESALIAAKLPTQIDQATYNRLLGSNASSTTTVATSGSYSYSAIAQELFNNASKGDILAVLDTLAKINNANEYREVSNLYRTITESRTGVTQSIVTGLLDVSFRYNESAKAKLRQEFLRMGLVESGGKWSIPGTLTGFSPYKDIIALVNTFVQDAKGNRYEVKKGTILGEELHKANGMTYFKAIDQSRFAVPTRDVKYV